MNDGSPYFYAWYDDADRVDAFATALSALVAPRGKCSVDIRSIESPGNPWLDAASVEDVVAAVRVAFDAGTHVFASFTATLRSGSKLAFALECNGEAYERLGPSGPLCASPFDRKDLLSNRLDIAVSSGARSVEVEGAIVAMRVQENIEDILTGLCAQEARARPMMGACTDLGIWHAPVEMCATYHADAASVVRDLAISWLHLHDCDPVQHAAGMSMDALRMRIDSAPSGARVPVAGSVKLVLEHLLLERVAATARETRHATGDAIRRGTRVDIPGDVALSREAVLQALSAPPGALLEALEASAVPDDEWRAVEPSALETIEATKAGAPTYKVDVTTRKHVQFIERHAPYHVRRLPGGGVLLATHPYRTLWTLYSDALFLLGITPS